MPAYWRLVAILERWARRYGPPACYIKMAGEYFVPYRGPSTSLELLHMQGIQMHSAAKRIVQKWSRHHATDRAFYSEISGLWVLGQRKTPHPFDKICGRIADLLFLYATINQRPDLVNFERITL